MPPARLALPLTAALSAVIGIAACSKAPVPTEDVRPVRTLTVSPRSTSATVDFAGEVRPRVETRAGFQVAGRMTQRFVEVGQLVRRGQPLATIDPQDYRLAAEASEAARTSAQVDRDQQRADMKRFDDLHRQGFISGAELERRRAQLDAAEARYAQASALADVSTNQAAYATLRIGRLLHRT